MKSSRSDNCLDVSLSLSQVFIVLHDSVRKLILQNSWLEQETKPPNTTNFNPNQADQNEYFFAMDRLIDLIPSCKFKFVSCLEIYFKKSIWTMEGPWKTMTGYGPCRGQSLYMIIFMFIEQK